MAFHYIVIVICKSTENKVIAKIVIIIIITIIIVIIITITIIVPIWLCWLQDITQSTTRFWRTAPRLECYSYLQIVYFDLHIPLKKAGFSLRAQQLHPKHPLSYFTDHIGNFKAFSTKFSRSNLCFYQHFDFSELK